MNKLTDKISLSELWDFSHPFFIIAGTFGVGKSFLVEQIKEQIAENKEENIFIIHFDLENIKEIEDLSKATTCSFISAGITNNIELDDLPFFLDRFSSLKKQVSNYDINLYEKLIETYELKDYFKFDLSESLETIRSESVLKKLETLFSKKSDIRILTTLFDVLTEAILKSILQTANQYSFNNKYKIFFFFDNYENCSSTIDNWIYNHIYKYLNSKTIFDFKSYEIRLEIDKTKLSDLFDFKFIISTRYDFVLKFLLKKESREKIHTIHIEPYTKEQCLDYLSQISSNFDGDTFFKITQGIPFVINQFQNTLNFQIDEPSKKELFKIVYQKIISRIPHNLEKTLQFLAFLGKYSEEAIRWATDDVENYPQIFRYFSANSDLSQVIWLKNQIFKIKDHYQYFITNYIIENMPDKFELIVKTKEQFLKGFATLENLPLIERKILRNLAYFKEFQIGDILHNIFKEDTESVIDFVKSQKDYFIAENKVFRLPDELRNVLLEFNRLVDKERFEQKREYIKNMVETYKNELISRRKNLESDIENLNQKKAELEKQSDNLHLEILTKKDQLLLLENQIIDVKNKKNTFSKRFTWRTFIVLAIISLVFFWAGNNIIYFFDENYDSEAVRGLGVSLKILSLLLIAIITFFVIDYFAISKTKKENINRVEEFLNQIEKERSELERELNQLTQSYNAINSEIQNLNDELKKLRNKKEEIDIALNVDFVE
jgi:cell division protein FtsB